VIQAHDSGIVGGMKQAAHNIDHAEIDKFEQLASRWWDPDSEFKPLHDINPLRLDYINRRAPLADRKVIDVGCGSGILAVAALKLGARQALAVDIDPDALHAVRENSALNGVADRLDAGLGSVAEICRGGFAIQRAPLVLANILATVIIKLLDEGLGALVTPGGSLVLSGILAEQVGDVEHALRSNGLKLLEKRQQEDWVALLAQPE
jgi:ribosomal protein L11 methyltransferase